jgi:hypothetical protein
MRPLRSSRPTRFATFLVAMGVTHAAQSKPLHTWLAVEKLSGSESCPDEHAVFKAVARLFPETALERSYVSTDVVASATVTIHPVLGGHEALVQVTAPRPGEHTIAVKDADCRGLDEALAVTLVLLLEPERDGAVPIASAPETTNTAPPSTAPPTPPTRQKPSTRARTQEHAVTAPFGSRSAPSAPHVWGYARVTGFAGLGVLAKPAAGPTLGLSLVHETGLGLSVEGLRLWSQSAFRDGGKVDISLWGLLLGPCYRHRMTPSWRTSACVLLGLGEQHAVAAGYRQPGSANRPWLVFGSTLSLYRRLSAPLSGSLSIGSFGHLRSQGFTVEGVGTVAEPPTAGVMAQLGLEVDGAIF